MKTLILLTIAVALGVFRFTLPPTHLSVSGSYQAVAHLFVGGLFGVGYANKDRECIWIAWGLTVVEVVAAVVTRL